jgi:4-amino-4-deoxychorismate lyase
VTTPARVLVNGEPGAALSVMDRGLGYGDGLFETIRFAGAQAPLWRRHMARLAEGCARLALPAPEPGTLWREAQAVAQGMAQAVVKIVYTRGIGERGYAPPGAPAPTRVLAASEAPPAAPGEGLRLHLCETRLAVQPRLAGIKHLNRLEQVLARAEWSDPAIGEGLLRDTEGRVVSATAANLFAVVGGALVTPPVDRCGIAGVARAEVLAARPDARVRALALDELLGADEIFLSSSVRGIVPVRELAGRVFAPGAAARALQAHWRTLGFSQEQVG